MAKREGPNIYRITEKFSEKINEAFDKTDDPAERMMIGVALFSVLPFTFLVDTITLPVDLIRSKVLKK